MGGVDLDDVEAGGAGAVGGCYKVFDDFVHADAVKSGRERVGLVETDGGGGDGLPAAFRDGDGARLFPWNGHAGFAAGVG